MPEYLVVAGLALIMALTLVLPFSVKKVEEELEIFLFIMGVIAVTISGLWSGHLVLEAMKEPLPITAAVLGLGFVFRAVRPRLKGWLNWLVFKTGLTGAIFLMVLFLGLASSLITAIIASLLLAEIFTVLRLRRDFEVKAVVYACFAIGLGAALTPLGEPLSTIVVSKLKGPPHYADFFYLLRLLGAWIIPG
ncbi:MAG TPA: DUF1646 family protein, partial [Elusimicrobiales bacterium]|nr:DUF1646 family protein [Elusimicrobiales bacterium]